MENPNNNKKDTKKTFESMMIPQRFEWTGLSQQQQQQAKDDKDKNNMLDFLSGVDDLVLWHVLGFVVDENDYLNPMLVCKRWKGFIEIISPPSIARISKIVYNTNNPSDDLQVYLLRDVLNKLQHRSCPLYKKEPKKASKEASKETPQRNVVARWPNVQPRFNSVLMVYTNCICTQRGSIGSRGVYEIACTFLTSLGTKTIDSMVGSMKQKVKSVGEQGEKSWKDIMPLMDSLLEDLLEQWHNWEGIVTITSNICDYVNRYHIKHHNCRSLQKVANDSVADCLKNTLTSLRSSTTGAWDQFLTTTDDTDQFLLRDSVSLAVVAQFCSEIMGVVSLKKSDTTEQESSTAHQQHSDRLVNLVDIVKNNFGLDEWTVRCIISAIHRIQGQHEMKVIEENKFSSEGLTKNPIKIITLPENEQFNVPLHFIKSSQFLCHLHLEAGDTIKLKCKPKVLEKAIAFYTLDEAHPFPELARPLQCDDIEQLFGVEYAKFAELLDNDMKFELVTLSNLLDMKNLIDFGCALVSLMIRRRSPSELRSMFGL